MKNYKFKLNSVNIYIDETDTGEINISIAEYNYPMGNKSRTIIDNFIFTFVKNYIMKRPFIE